MEKPYVYVTRRVPEEALIPLREYAEVNVWPKEEEPVPLQVLLEEAKKADGLFTMLSDQIDAELIEQAPKLKVVANLAVGFDNIDVEAASKHGIAVCNTPDVLTDTTADLTFALLMATGRRIVESAEYIKDGKWKNWGPLLLAGTDIHHKTIGIVGMGRIGSAVAKRASGFDMNILYYNRSRKEDVEKALDATYTPFDELIEMSDYIVCLAPLTDETKNMFTENVFKRMKPSAIFINASRGGVVDEEALTKALAEKEIAGAGLDVFKEEPIGADHPLLQFRNVVALPHIGSASVETRYDMAKLASRNIVNVLRGERPEALLNEEIF
ncbi:2-hydroxyacid dehydrogenase [Evansella halocellulosilytica]|uniref:2-hydroxyacid dehydrogenase n=1 Tax=Evansella halocellulosilytica TaxID=2011013 RepID=UPI000BB707E8|nr:D-glycerate dehydrogenase [Evansella halocellulosilytica]